MTCGRVFGPVLICGNSRCGSNVPSARTALRICSTDRRRLTMTDADWPVHSRFAKEHFGRGKAEGLAAMRVGSKAEGGARSVLRVFAVRGVEVPDDVRVRIRACSDLRQLEVWLERSV